MAKKKKKKNKNKKKSLPLRNKLINGLILLIVLLAFSLLGIFMTGKILEPTNLARLLPAEQTIGFITANTQEFPYDPTPDLLELEKTQAATAYLINTAQEVEEVYFFQYADRLTAENALKALLTPEEELQQEKYEGITIYSYPLSQNFSASFVANYLVLAENQDNLKLIIDASHGNASNLKSLQYYNTVANNLPYNATAVTYWNLQNDTNFITDYLPIYDLLPETLVAPVLSIFPAFGAAAQTAEEGFYVQTYIAVEKDMISDGYYFSFREKYRANLTEFIPENPTIFWGGQDMYSELDRLMTLFNQFHPSAAVIFEAILRGKAQEYFGTNIDLEEDIYPLLEEEYALAKYTDGSYLCLIALGNQDAKQINIDTIKKGFLEQQIYSDHYIQTYTLEDGSTAQEIVADLVEISVDTMTYEGVDIDAFSLSNGDMLGYMTVFADNFAFSTNLQILQHSIDLMKGPDGSLAASEDMISINEIMTSADEASFLDLTDLREDEFWGSELFADFSSISTTKNFFNDGISTFHLVKY